MYKEKEGGGSSYCFLREEKRSVYEYGLNVHRENGWANV